MGVGAVRKCFSAIASITLMLLSIPTLAQDTRPYTQGNVLEVTSVLTKPGKFDEYMNYLASTYRQQMEELKKAGLVLDYSFYTTLPRRPGDADLYLVVTYPNMAAFDSLDEKSEAIQMKLGQTMKQAAEGMASRESMRTILGSEVIRQLKLK